MYNYPYKKYRNLEMFNWLRMYLLLNTGRPLFIKQITAELNEKFAHKNVNTNDVTVAKYLLAMCPDEIDNDKHRELFKLKREYVKPHYNKNGTPGEIDYGVTYYFTYPIEELKEMYKAIPEDISKKFKGHSWIYIERLTYIAQQLYGLFRENLKCGALIHRYYNDKHTEVKLTITADFVVSNGESRDVFMVGSSTSLFKSQIGKKYNISQLDILNAIKNLKDVNVYIVGIWNCEPKKEEYTNMKKTLGEQINYIHWKQF